MLPLSFKEYANYYKTEGDEKLYLKYVNSSSMPYALKLDRQDEIDKYLDSIYNTIIVKDIALRKKYLILECLEVYPSLCLLVLVIYYQ